MKKKLTLSIDEKLIKKIKAIALKKGKTVSALVEDFIRRQKLQ